VGEEEMPHTLSHEHEGATEEKGDGKEASPKFRQKRSRILIQITALLVVVLIASGLATFFLIRGYQNRLIEKSTDKLIETQVKGVYTAYQYITNLLVPTFVERLGDTSEEELIDALLNERLTGGQEFVDDELQKMVDDGVLGLETIMVIVPPSILHSETLILACNDESLIYTWEVPDYIEDAVEEGDPYIWMENGVPELGLEGEYLIVIADIRGDVLEGRDTGQDQARALADQARILAFRPMHQDIAAINDYYNQEKRNLNILLALVILGSIIVVMLIIFFVLSYLIRKRITEPIDELAAAAEEVMQGDLEVDMPVREGEEFAGLKQAFNQMVASLRGLIARSVGEE
jgi:HAMP domain-containing protein